MHQLLQRLLTSTTLSPEEWQQLEQMTLQDQQRARTFGVSAATVGDALRERSTLLQQVYPELAPFLKTRLIDTHSALETLWRLWLPLALRLASQQRQRPLVQGILGGQGTGKTTLGFVLTVILKHLGYQTLSFSLDDLYKTYAERLHLRKQDPRLIWRGPPGTHDVDLGLHTLDQLRSPVAGSPISIPRFDKSLHNGAGDRTHPDYAADIDIVLFEGWFVGAKPIDPIAFETAPEPITTDADRAFAGDTNTRLHAYLPLWQRLDGLTVLYPVDYRFSKQWRRQAEQEMRAAGKPGMTDIEIDAFVNYFWKALTRSYLLRHWCRHQMGQI
jgi:D-glycerate 3-kinase